MLVTANTLESYGSGYDEAEEFYDAFPDGIAFDTLDEFVSALKKKYHRTDYILGCLEDIYPELFTHTPFGTFAHYYFYSEGRVNFGGVSATMRVEADRAALSTEEALPDRALASAMHLAAQIRAVRENGPFCEEGPRGGWPRKRNVS